MLKMQSCSTYVSFEDTVPVKKVNIFFTFAENPFTRFFFTEAFEWNLFLSILSDSEIAKIKSCKSKDICSILSESLSYK